MPTRKESNQESEVKGNGSQRKSSRDREALNHSREPNFYQSKVTADYPQREADKQSNTSGQKPPLSASKSNHKIASSYKSPVQTGDNSERKSQQYKSQKSASKLLSPQASAE